jgi:hypothetical protein
MTEPLVIVREGGNAMWVRMLVDGENLLYLRIHFPDFHPNWIYYPDNPALHSEYKSQDQEKLEKLFQGYGGI